MNRAFGLTSAMAVLALLVGGASAGGAAEPELKAEAAAPGQMPAPPVSGEVQPPLPYIDLDRTGHSVPLYETDDAEWGFQTLPEGLIYRAYLAGPKESRLYTSAVRIPDDSWLWDATLGARVGVFRLGTRDPVRPRGLQMDVEASVQARLDLMEEVDLRSADYRVGVPLTWGNERSQWKFGYYHISSHVGDEFLLKNPAFPVFFQCRDALVLGHSLYLTDSLRMYLEAAWAFQCRASEPWEFQFGVDYAPRAPTGPRGAPFVALNGHLRQEVNFGGGLTAQTGWAWRSDHNARLVRVGLQYYNGQSPQYVFLPYHEQQIGVSFWYDF